MPSSAARPAPSSTRSARAERTLSWSRAGLWQDAGLTKKDYFVKQNGLTKPDTQLQTYRANIGGPVVRDKAHFFFNVERVMVDRATTITIPARPEFNASPVTQDRVWNTLVRFDHQLSANNTWAVRWLRESSPQLNQIIPVVYNNNPITGTFPVTENASREENDVDQTVVATLNSVIGKNRFNTFRVNFTQEDVAFANPNFNGNQDDGADADARLHQLRRSAEQRGTGARERRVPDRRHDVVVHHRPRQP
jgi:hypothetical protein